MMFQCLKAWYLMASLQLPKVYKKITYNNEQLKTTIYSLLVADTNPSAPPASGQQQQPSQSQGSVPAGSSGGGVNTAPQTAAGSGSAAQGGGDALGNLPTSTSFGNTVFPGSASFLTPTGSGSVSPLFRLDGQENVTFVWEYESVSVRPINITLAAAGPNSVTYTIAALQGGATSAVWHIANIPRESPLMNGYYQIQLYDQRGISASESPGWLSPQTTLTIAFYSGETYANATDTAGKKRFKSIKKGGY